MVQNSEHVYCVALILPLLAVERGDGGRNGSVGEPVNKNKMYKARHLDQVGQNGNVGLLLGLQECADVLSNVGPHSLGLQSVGWYLFLQLLFEIRLPLLFVLVNNNQDNVFVRNRKVAGVWVTPQVKNTEVSELGNACVNCSLREAEIRSEVFRESSIGGIEGDGWGAWTGLGGGVRRGRGLLSSADKSGTERSKPSSALIALGANDTCRKKLRCFSSELLELEIQQAREKLSSLSGL